jgi:3-deoxy-7-phosphoheptulonate synthase
MKVPKIVLQASERDAKPTEELLFSKEKFTVVAGPCSIESKEQLLAMANAFQDYGLSLIRGGVWKMRTDPNSFQGLGEKAIEILKYLKEELRLRLITEVSDPRQLDFLHPWTSVYQVGARNMFNYALLKELAQQEKPVLLKRSFGATLNEWIKASEYLAAGKNPQVVLCERGIRTFETSARYTFDLNSVLIAKQETGLPVFVDPSHAIGLREFVPQLCFAAAAAGADGLLIEVHPEPEKSISDARQAISIETFHEIMQKLEQILPIFNRSLNTILEPQ